jgi:hypothetical protein
VWAIDETGQVGACLVEHHGVGVRVGEPGVEVAVFKEDVSGVQRGADPTPAVSRRGRGQWRAEQLDTESIRYGATLGDQPQGQPGRDWDWRRAGPAVSILIINPSVKGQDEVLSGGLATSW